VLGITQLPIDYQFWYVRDLFLLVVISPLVWLAMKHARLVTLAVLAVLWSELLPGAPLAASARSLLFFSLGIALVQTSRQKLLIPQHAALFLILSLLEAPY